MNCDVTLGYQLCFFFGEGQSPIMKNNYNYFCKKHLIGYNKDYINGLSTNTVIFKVYCVIKYTLLNTTFNTKPCGVALFTRAFKV